MQPRFGSVQGMISHWTLEETIVSPSRIVLANFWDLWGFERFVFFPRSIESIGIDRWIDG